MDLFLHVSSVVRWIVDELFVEDLVGRLCCGRCDLGVCVEGSVRGARRNQKLSVINCHVLSDFPMRGSCNMVKLLYAQVGKEEHVLIDDFCPYTKIKRTTVQPKIGLEFRFM